MRFPSRQVGMNRLTFLGGAATSYAFLLRQTGMKDYQPTSS
jgi:hypothetical protein